MSFYKTSEFIRDNYWLFDKLLNVLGKFQKFVKRQVKSFLNFDYESRVLQIIENLPYGFLLLFLGFFLCVFLIKVTEGPEGLRVFPINTASMSPAVLPGSLLFSYPEKSYNAGDIVSYREKYLENNAYTGRILTHRIIEKKVVNGYYVYTLKGDSNTNPDPGNVRSGDLVGKVIIILPYVGYIDFLITTVPGFIIFIGIPTVIVLWDVRKYLFS